MLTVPILKKPKLVLFYFGLTLNNCPLVNKYIGEQVVVD